MTSTTPAEQPRPQGRAEQVRAAEPEPVVPMRTLLASCAAAAAVSTPPERQRSAAGQPEPRRAA
ncbi:hypothetical protein [Kitasatospora camelliae]|uniref:Uncharacterized protein n=1 Tax=Kitasatospora camelliae TaxID=3156397 RepID=A0AAU8JXQ8_9ACTN